MHAAYFSALASAAAFVAGVCEPRSGRSFLQACWAAWNCGDPVLRPLLPPALMVQLGRPFDPSVGSGKLLSPCERMHAEYFSASFISSVRECPDAPAEPGEDGGLEAEAGEFTCATPPLLEPPPQPASNMVASNAAATAAPANRRLRPLRRL